MLFADDKLGMTIRLEGIPFDGVDDNQLYVAFANLKNLFNAIGKLGGNNVAIWTTTKRRRIDFDRAYQFHNTFAKAFSSKYLERFNTNKYFENVFYITVILKYEELDDGIRDMEEIKAILTNSLTQYDPYVLTAYQNQHEVIFSEVLAFFADF